MSPFWPGLYPWGPWGYSDIFNDNMDSDQDPNYSNGPVPSPDYGPGPEGPGPYSGEGYGMPQGAVYPGYGYGPAPSTGGDPGTGWMPVVPQYPQEPGPPPPRPPYTGGALAAPAPPQEERLVTLIYRDGRPPEQIRNYMLTRTTLTVFDQPFRQIPLNQIDLAQTVATNREAGVDFRVPDGPH